MHLLATRTLFAIALITGLGVAVAARSPGGGAPPIPTSPEVPQIPVAPTVLQPILPTDSRHVRFQNLLPGQGKGVEGEKKGEGDKKADKSELPLIVETGPELTLGECITIALERQPSLKAVKASLAASEDGYRSLSNFGTVGTFFSPDLDIRKQQAQRGLAAAAAQYQQAHNEIVQDVTRLYYSAVYAKQQQAIADNFAGTLDQTVESIRAILDTEPDPKKLEGLTRGKLFSAENGLK